MIPEIDLSRYRPTPDQRRFSISTFAIAGVVTWAAKPGGEFDARVEVLKGAFAKMIPFAAMEASVHVSKTKDGEAKRFVMKTIGARAGAKVGGREQVWDDVSVLSPIEIPWVAEYAFSRYSVGGPSEVQFTFEDGQRRRVTVLKFRDDPSAADGDGMAWLRVLKPDEPATSLGEKPDSRPGDVLVTFRGGQVSALTLFVPIVGKLQFVAV